MNYIIDNNKTYGIYCNAGTLNSTRPAILVAKRGNYKKIQNWKLFT